MSVEAYEKGARVRFWATFKTLDEDLADPTTVVFKCKDPNGAVVERTLAGGQVIRESLGVFYADVDINVSGDWAGRWEGAGALVAVEEFTFIARKTAFV